MDVVVGHIAGQRQRHRDRILVGLEDVGRRLDLVGGDRKTLGKIFQRRRDRFPAAEVARHAGKADLGVRNRDLAVLQFADLIEQQQRGIVETRRRAARQIHLIDDLDAAETGAGRLEQFALAGRQRRTAAKRDPDDVPLGRPDERLGFGNQTGFVVDQPHARHGLHRGHRAATAVFREGIRGEGDVAAGDRDPALVEHGILERRGRAGGQIGFQRRGARPGRDGPKDDQWNHARPPFAAPPEKSVHSMFRGGVGTERKQTLARLSNWK